MSMNPDLMTLCRCRRIQQEVNKLQQQIRINKSLLWRHGILGRIKIICANFKLDSKCQTLRNELEKIKNNPRGGQV